MPQMKPMNWMILYFLLGMIMMFMNIMNYFINIDFINKKIKNKILKKKMNWKW